MQSALRICAAAACALLLGPAAAGAEEVDLNSVGAIGSELDPILFLDVYVNGQPRNLIAEFKMGADGSVSARPAELREIGLSPPEEATGTGWFDLSLLPGGEFSYDELQQRIYIKTAAEGLSVTGYSAQPVQGAGSAASASSGFYLNYDIGAFAHAHGSSSEVEFDGLSSRLEAWSFGPLGTLHNSALLSHDGSANGFSARRLDSFYSVSNVETQTNLRAGDLINGGLSWTRPIRMAGIQLRRSFETRPDLITTPLPSFSGSANVPSTVDVFLGNIKLSSTDIDPGRFDLHDIPAPAANGNLRVVVQGQDGSYQDYELPFFADESLLKKGLLDFSAEVGVPRTGYGTEVDQYGVDPVATGSIRYGLSDTLTLEGHGEFSADLLNGGLGAVASLGPLGRLHASLSASQFDNRWGAQFSAEYDLSAGPFHLGLATTRQFGDYADLARTTARLTGSGDQGTDRAISFDRAFLSFAPQNQNWSSSLGVSHLQKADGERVLFGTVSFNRKLSDNAHFYAYGQSDLDDLGEFGVYAGLTFQLGGGRSTSVGASFEDDTILASTSYSRSVRDGPNQRQYGLTLSGGADEAELSGHAGWTGNYTQSRARFSAGGDESYFSGGVKGALLVQDGKIAATRYIDDAFVMVIVGVPDVPVMLENRLAGVTDRSGKLVLSGLRSYEPYKVSIDPNTLPLHYPVTNVSRTVTVPERSGATLDFTADGQAARQALVELVDGEGNHLPAGSAIMVPGSEENHVVGYDGQAYLPVQAGENIFVIDNDGRQCGASVTVADGAEHFVEFSQVVCD